MIRIPDISIMVVHPSEARAEPFRMRCMGGHARWTRVLGTLILQADIIMDAVAHSALAYLGSKQSRFDLDIGYSKHDPDGALMVTQFVGCGARELSGRDLATRPYGQLCRRYQMTIRAEPAAGGNAE
jgi:hypothetical protein